MERFNNNTIQSLENILGISHLTNFPKHKFESKTHIVWTHPDFDWNPQGTIAADSKLEEKVKTKFDLTSEINLTSIEILSDISSLDSRYLQLIAKERKNDLSNTFGNEKQILYKDPVFRLEAEKLHKILTTFAKLYSTAKILYLARKISANKDNIINLGISSQQNSAFLKNMIYNYCDNSNTTFFITSTETNGFFMPDEETARQENYLLQYKRFKSAAKRNKEVYLLGGYVGECVLNTLQNLYMIYEKVNVLYEFCKGPIQINSSFSTSSYPGIIQKIIEDTLIEKNLTEKIKILIKRGTPFLVQEYKNYFNPYFLEHNRDHKEIKEHAHKIKLVSGKCANKQLQINTFY